MTTWTPTQQRIYDLLSDGRMHQRKELEACLNDDMAGQSTLRFHICVMRRKLRPIGENIASTILDQRTYYQHVRFIR
jgi:hypothetical protein